MTENELSNQELGWHEERVDWKVEHRQAVNLGENKRGIARANQNSAVARVVNIVYFLFAALELLLAVRVIFYLIGVNADNNFASFIYGLSAPFVTAFAILVQNPTVNGTGVLEITTLIAMLVWAIVSWLVGQFIWLTLSHPQCRLYSDIWDGRG